MQILNFTCKNQNLTAECPGRLVVAESRQHIYAKFVLDEEWDGLGVTVIFAHDLLSQSYARQLTAEPVEIPPEVLVEGRLRVSLEGLGNGGAYRLPTAYMTKPIVVHRAGALVGIQPENATPELWEQALALIGDLSELDTVDKSSLVAAINEANRTKVNEEDIKNAVDEYLEENPVQGGAQSWNDLLDRPFYETITEGTEILPITTITFSGGRATIPRGTYTGNFVDGQKYAIEIDGVPHLASAMYIKHPDDIFLLTTEDETYNATGYWAISGPHEDGDATIRIYEVAVEIKTLDSKFLTMDEEVLANSNNPVPGKVLYDALGGKLDKKYDTASAGRLLAVDPTGYVALRRDGMVGATASEAGSSGFVPAPAAGDQDKVLHGDGTWGAVEASGGAGVHIGPDEPTDESVEVWIDTDDSEGGQKTEVWTFTLADGSTVTRTVVLA